MVGPVPKRMQKIIEKQDEVGIQSNALLSAEQLAGVLHGCGVDAYTDYMAMGRSGDEWNAYRLHIAKLLLGELDVKYKGR